MKKMRNLVVGGLMLSTLLGCSKADHFGRPPSFTPTDAGRAHLAMAVPGLPRTLEKQRVVDQSSLWSGGSRSLLGDHRAAERGDILTIVIEIDEKAEIQNSTSRSRSSKESLQMPQLFGLPQRLDERLPEGATSADAVSIGSNSDMDGDGSVKRKEKLTLRVAATVTDVLPSGVMRIEGSQEVRVNFEMRELLVEGYVRPDDVSRTNEITYDKIASARISYGGRGQITDVQQPRYGQQVLDAVLPF
jgi:flagellar L-ring protein precursor FlgH